MTARVGALIEGPGFYPYLSGRDNLRVLARYRGLPESAADDAPGSGSTWPTAAPTGSGPTRSA